MYYLFMHVRFMFQITMILQTDFFYYINKVFKEYFGSY